MRALYAQTLLFLCSKTSVIARIEILFEKEPPMSLQNKIKRALQNPHLIPRAFKNRISTFYKLYLIKDEFTVAAAKWVRDEGDKNLRLTYPLSNKSIVFDLGGYEGDFAADIYSKYGCHVYVFEPVKRYYLDCVNRFKENKKIKCFNYGLSNENGSFLIGNDNDGSSLIRNNTSATCEEVFIKIFSDELIRLKVEHIDLLKINIEGAEFLILRDIFSKKIISKIKHLQVQFHTFFPDSKILRDEIRAKLSETHVEEWNYPFVWESWRRKKLN